jgi:hypothetical protein
MAMGPLCLGPETELSKQRQEGKAVRGTAQCTRDRVTQPAVACNVWPDALCSCNLALHSRIRLHNK